MSELARCIIPKEAPMRNLESRVRCSTFAVIAILAAIATAQWSTGAERNEILPADRAASLAAWDKIATVLQNPRCLNCHQLDSPLQGDTRRVHIPRVVRGADGHGVGAMRCGNCHNDMGNNPTSGTPGGLHWQLAPVSMLWQGLSVGDLCRAVKDPKVNGNRTADDLIKHMEDEPLVLYGWNPGKGREPVPIPHEKTVEYMKIWVAGGMACPK
jgi:mono/diheme cytochrome c family protein